MFISLCYATGGLSLPSHDTLAVWATQSTFLERSLVHSAKCYCPQEHLNNGVFCSRIFSLCTPLKYDHPPNIATDIWHAVSQPKQAIGVCFVASNAKRKERKKFWLHPITSQRSLKGKFYSLYEDLKAHPQKV